MVLGAIRTLYNVTDDWKNDLFMHMERSKKELQNDIIKWKYEQKVDMERWKNDMTVSMIDWKQEIKDDFRLVTEDLRHDLIGIHHDKIQALDDTSKNHGKRIRYVETKLAI